MGNQGAAGGISERWRSSCSSYIHNGWHSKCLIMQRPVLKAICADGYMYFYAGYLYDASNIYYTGWKSSVTLYQSTTWWTALCLHYNCISHSTLQFPLCNDPIGIYQNMYQIMRPIQRILNSVCLHTFFVFFWSQTFALIFVIPIIVLSS